MESKSERRREKRLKYSWPVWFAEDFDQILFQGQMIDVSSGGAAFTCSADEGCHYPGQRITARFSIPRYQSEDSFDMANVTRTGHVCRVDNSNGFNHRIAIQFAEPLNFRPGEQPEGEKASQALDSVMV
jgi:hypothetical protein